MVNKLMPFLILPILIFNSNCKNEQKDSNSTVHQESTITTSQLHEKDVVKKITDSIFIGEPLVSKKEFIKNIVEGGENYKYFDQYNNIVHKTNQIFSSWPSNKSNKIILIGNGLSLELSRTPYGKKDKEKDIQIMLYTKKGNTTQDSILFFKYQIDKNFPDDQRFEVLTYLDNDLNLWYLETSTGFSEFAISIKNWDKYKINKTTGKIEIVTKGIPYNK